MAFAFPVAIHESSDKLGQLLTVLGFRDEAVPGVTHTLTATQGVGGEAVRTRTKTSSMRMSTSFLLLVASSSILTRMWWSGAGDGSGSTVA